MRGKRIDEPDHRVLVLNWIRRRGYNPDIQVNPYNGNIEGCRVSTLHPEGRSEDEC